MEMELLRIEDGKGKFIVDMFTTVPGHNKYMISTNGIIVNKKTKRVKRPRVERDGYLQVSLRTDDAKGNKFYQLHRLIMMTFCYFEGCKELEVDHIDRNRQNNDLSNLRWADKEIQAQNKSETRKQMTRLDEETKKLIREQYRPYHAVYGFKQMAERYGICTTTLRKILSQAN